MMKIEFLADYRGVLTSERFFELGSQAEFENTDAQKLIDQGRAIEVIEVVKPPAKATTRTKRTRKPRTRKKAT